MITYYVNNKGFEVSDHWVEGCWTCVTEPNDDENGFLVNGLDIPESFLSDIDDKEERPRKEEEDGWQLIVIRVPFRCNESHIDYNTVPLGIIIKDNVFVTVCNNKVEMVDDFVVYSIRKQLDVVNPYELVMRLMLSSSVWFLKYLKHINNRIMNIEGRLQQNVRNEEILELQRLENSLVYFVTSLKGNDILFYRMAHTKTISNLCDEELLEDVEIELKQAEETTSIYRNIIHSMSNSYSSVISNNINQTMKTLTSISLILMLPTLIASLYGMNVPNYWENEKYAFLYILGGASFLGLLMYIFFKRRNLF